MKNSKIQFDRQSGRYYGRVQVCGNRKRFWLGRSRRGAEQEWQRINREIAAGRIVVSEVETSRTRTEEGCTDIRIEELVHEHLKWVKTNRSEATLLMRQHYVGAFLKFVGPCMVSDITRLTLESFHANMKKASSGTKKGPGQHLRHVKTMLLWAEEVELCPCPVKKFPRLTHPPPETRRIPEEDLGCFLDKAPADLRDLVLFGILTGLRPQEMRALRFEHVQREGDGLARIVMDRHKTSASSREPVPRSVPLCERADRIVEHEWRRHPDSGYVFLNAAGGHYSASVLRNRVLRWCRRIGIEEFTPYALRHTFASMEAEAGVNQASLAQMMGHSSTRTTARYISSTESYHRTAIDALAERVANIHPGDDEDNRETKVAPKVAPPPVQENPEGKLIRVKGWRTAG
jgi:integrase